MTPGDATRLALRNGEGCSGRSGLALVAVGLLVVMVPKAGKGAA